MITCTGTVLETTLPVDDPGVRTVTLRPNEATSGKILLDDRFPGFTAALAQKDVAVFGAYPRPSADGWLNGFMLFPTTKKAK